MPRVPRPPGFSLLWTTPPSLLRLLSGFLVACIWIAAPGGVFGFSLGAASKGLLSVAADPGVVPRWRGALPQILAGGGVQQDPTACEDLRQRYGRACHSDVDVVREYGDDATLVEVGRQLANKLEQLRSRWRETVAKIRRAADAGRSTEAGGEVTEQLSRQSGDHLAENDVVRFAVQEDGDWVSSIPGSLTVPAQILDALSLSDDVTSLQNTWKNPFAALQEGLGLASATALLKWFSDLRKEFLNQGHGSLFKLQSQCLDLRARFYEAGCPGVLKMYDPERDASHQHALTIMETVWRPRLRAGNEIVGVKLGEFLRQGLLVTKRRFLLEGAVERERKAVERSLREMEEAAAAAKEREAELKEWEAEFSARQKQTRALVDKLSNELGRLAAEIKDDSGEDYREGEEVDEHARRLERRMSLIRSRLAVRDRLFAARAELGDVFSEEALQHSRSRSSSSIGSVASATASTSAGEDFGETGSSSEDLAELRKIQQALDADRERWVHEHFEASFKLREEWREVSVRDTIHDFVTWLQEFRGGTSGTGSSAGPQPPSPRVGVFHFRIWWSNVERTEPENWVIVGLRSAQGSLAILHAFPRWDPAERERGPFKKFPYDEFALAAWVDRAERASGSRFVVHLPRPEYGDECGSVGLQEPRLVSLAGSSFEDPLVFFLGVLNGHAHDFEIYMQKSFADMVEKSDLNKKKASNLELLLQRAKNAEQVRFLQGELAKLRDEEGVAAARRIRAGLTGSSVADAVAAAAELILHPPPTVSSAVAASVEKTTERNRQRVVRIAGAQALAGAYFHNFAYALRLPKKHRFAFTPDRAKVGLDPQVGRQTPETIPEMKKLCRKSGYPYGIVVMPFPKAGGRGGSLKYSATFAFPPIGSCFLRNGADDSQECLSSSSSPAGSSNSNSPVGSHTQIAKLYGLVRGSDGRLKDDVSVLLKDPPVEGADLCPLFDQQPSLFAAVQAALSPFTTRNLRHRDAIEGLHWHHEIVGQGGETPRTSSEKSSPSQEVSQEVVEAGFETAEDEGGLAGFETAEVVDGGSCIGFDKTHWQNLDQLSVHVAPVLKTVLKLSSTTVSRELETVVEDNFRTNICLVTEEDEEVQDCYYGVPAACPIVALRDVREQVLGLAVDSSWSQSNVEQARRRLEDRHLLGWSELLDTGLGSVFDPPDRKYAERINREMTDGVCWNAFRRAQVEVRETARRALLQDHQAYLMGRGGGQTRSGQTLLSETKRRTEFMRSKKPGSFDDGYMKNLGPGSKSAWPPGLVAEISSGLTTLYNPDDHVGAGEGLTLFLEDGHDSLLVSPTRRYMGGRSRTATVGPSWLTGERAAEVLG